MPERTEQTCWAVWLDVESGNSRWAGTLYGSTAYTNASQFSAERLARQLTIPGQVATAVKVRVTVEPVGETDV